MDASVSWGVLAPLILLLLFLLLAAVIGGLVALVRSARARAATTAVLGVVATLSALVVLAAILFAWVGITKRQHVAVDHTDYSTAPRRQRVHGAYASQPADRSRLAGPGGTPGSVSEETPPERITAAPPIAEIVETKTAPVTSEPPESASDTASDAARKAPSWVTDPSGSEGNVVRMVVSAGPHSRLLDCNRELDEELVAAAKRYIADYVDHGHSKLVDITPSFMREHVVTEEYVETTSHSFGDMYRLHLLLQFDPEDHRALWEQSRRAVVHGRLWYMAFGLGAVLALLSTVFGYLRIDGVTDGQYKGRLILAAAGVILALLLAGRMLIEFVTLA